MIAVSELSVSTNSIIAIIAIAVPASISFATWLVRRVSDITATQRETVAVLQGFKDQHESLHKDHLWLRDYVMRQNPNAN